MNQGTKRVFDALNKTFYKYHPGCEPHPTNELLAEKIRKLNKKPVALPSNLFKNAFPLTKAKIDQDMITELSRIL